MLVGLNFLHGQGDVGNVEISLNGYGTTYITDFSTRLDYSELLLSVDVELMDNPEIKSNPSWLAPEVFVEVPLYSWLRVGGGVNYAPFRWNNSSLGFGRTGGRMRVALDLLWNDENESLLLTGGAAMGHASMVFGNDNFVEIVSQGNPNMKEQEILLEREFYYFQWLISMEWRDFFSPHFGYQLGFSISPTFQTSSRQINVLQYEIEGVPQWGDGSELRSGEAYESEQLEHWSWSLTLGLTYRF